MPFGQMLMSIAAVREVVGVPARENVNFLDRFYNETLFFYNINWMLNSTIQSKEIKNVNLTEIKNSSGSILNFSETHNADSLSIMWYLASFGTLVMFFLLISFSEVCCKKSFTAPPEEETEVRPPPYDLFAPPNYDSLYSEKKEKSSKKKKKKKCEVFVIHVFGDKSKSRVAPLESIQTDTNTNRNR